MILSSYFYLLLLIPIFVISLSLLEPGIIISHDFPIFDIGKIWTWVDKGSYSTIETLPRLPIIGLWQVMITVGINSSMISKLMIVSGFFAASFSSYFAFYHLSKRNIPTTDLKLKTAAILASIFYTYNVWSFIRINHWYLWIGYAILPLYILFTVYSFSNTRNWKYFFITSIIWSLASSTPHMAFFYGLIFFATFVVVFLNNSIKRGKWYQALVPFISIICIYSLLNAYWIYPFLEASRSYGIAPQYSLNYEIGQILSRESNFLNTLRLSSEWTNLLQLSPPSHSIIYPLWIFSSFAIPLLAFSALLFSREFRITLVYFAAVIIGLLLAMGTQSPLGYYVLVFLTPFGWLFRDPDKWSFLIAFGYSFLCGISIFNILKSDIRSFRLNNKVVYGSFISILLFLSIVFIYPIYKSTFGSDGTLKPISIPREFNTLNSYLSTLATDKIFYLPYPDYIGNPNENTSTTWSGGREVPSIYQINSLKPNIEIREPGIASPSLSNYYNHLEKSIIQNKVNNINNFIYPLGTQYLIFHDDVLDSPKDAILSSSLPYLKDLQNIHNVGFFKIFRVGNITDLANQVGVLNRNIGVIGGLDMLTSLNSIPSFSTINSSILFLDGVSKQKKMDMLDNSNDVVLGKSFTDLLVSLANNTYFAKPYDATIHHEPSKLWSKAGAMDPLHGDFHPYLNDLGIQNWDFDYDNGLVITKAMGAKIDIPIEVKDVQSYDLFIRYFKNQKGGEIRIYIDGNLIKQLDTLDRIGNNFIWEKIGSKRLTNGEHTLTIENSQGFNAINTFAYIPPDEIVRLKTQISRIMSEKNGIYLMEAESNFYNNNGKETGSFRYLFNDSRVANSSITYNSNDNNTVTKTFNGTFEVPSNSDLAQFDIWTKNDSSMNSSISISDLQIIPSYKKRTIFSSSFEGTEVGNLRNIGWVNNDKDLVSTSIFSDGAMEGNNSLKVNLAKSTKFGWSTISSRNIPINERSNYNASLEISAFDVKQLHSKILYLDSQRKVLSDEGDYIFEGKDGTFHGIFSASIVPPKDAKYLKFRILEKSENPKDAGYLVDDVKLEEIPTLTPILDKNLSIMKTLDKSNPTGYEIQSNTLPVLENRPYNYTFTTHSKNIGSVSALISFKSDTDVVENSTGYGHNASGGAVLSLSNGSKISTTLDIIKPSYYTMSLRANMCSVCTNLTINIAKSDFEINNNDDIKSMNVSLKGNDSGLHWVNSKSIYLRAGTYDLAISSNSKSDLDLVVVYPDPDSEVSKSNNENRHEKLNNIFSSETSSPAMVSSYKKINPTKYKVEITEATKPYMLSFAESYDPNWIAYYDNNDNYSNKTNKVRVDSETNSVPLYSITNGFYLKRTGNYTVFIEYLPQKWFTFGALITLGFILLSITIILVTKRKIIHSDITRVKQNSHLL